MASEEAYRIQSLNAATNTGTSMANTLNNVGNTMAHSYMLNADQHGSLPPGWEMRQMPNLPMGQVYYVDHKTRTTTWKRPTAGDDGAVNSSAQHTANQAGTAGLSDGSGHQIASQPEPLPHGWELRFTADGLSYFVDHNTQTTSWIHPSSASAVKNGSA
ncbi:hypothetical protein B0H34DRAFT_693064 [Crassisporium funariophilum]|nr:hypothetical protein B0H34DRAFT_693064 [Crassisporium funariophilum]